MATLPPSALLARYLLPVGRVTRRIEIYEADGVTPWNGYPFSSSFLIDGSVSVDYDRDERRTLDLTLDNQDGYFDSKPDGFWYDKVIKVFRGIQVNQPASQPKILVIQDATGIFMKLRNTLQKIGYTNLRVNTSVSTVGEMAGYDIIVVNDGTATPTKSTLVQAAWNAGYTIVTMGTQATQTQYPQVIGTTYSATGSCIFKPVTPVGLAVGWSQFTLTDNGSTKLVQTYASGAAAFIQDGANVRFPGVYRANGSSNQWWVHLCTTQMLTDAGTGSPDKMMQSIFKTINPNRPLTSWETQVGEFMIDSIDEANFPHQSVIKGRDYTKKLLLAKFAVTTQFLASVSTNTVETIIRGIAINGGINPNRIAIAVSGNGTRITSDVTFERDSTRWAAVKQLANDYNYEIFFDPWGTLIVRPYQDPTLGSPIFTFSTGEPTGSLVSYTKSANDSSLFNSITVAGESSDSTVIPVYVTLQNTNANSPSNITRLGIRSYTYTSPLITTTAQATALAKTYLSIYSLEEYSVNFESVCLEWLEAGDIIDIIPERTTSNTPTRFLFTSFSIPLQLGPMSGTGKRMLIVS